MSSFDCMDICRLCLIKEQVSVPIFGGEGDTRQIFLKISTCLPVKISRDDTLPKTICNNCVYRVESSYQFWNTTLNSEKQLLEWLNTSNVEQQQQQEQHIADKEFAADINNVAALLETENTTLETEQLMLKEEYLPDTSTTDLRYLHSRESNVVGIEERQEGVEEDDTDSCDDPAGEDDESDSEESGAETANQKTEIDDDVVEGENTTPLEPTTFVNVSLACDEPGPSGLQQQSGSITDGASTSAAVIPPGGFSEKKLHKIRKKKTQKNMTCEMNERDSDKSYVVNEHIPILKDESSDNNIANDIKPFTCTICYGAFATLKEYVRHVRRIHKGSKHVPCLNCGKTFSDARGLKRHLVVHSDDRPYSCNICKKSFKRKSGLQHHNRKHGGGRTFACDMCEYTTLYRHALVVHRKRHFDEYKFRCNICNKGFFAKTWLDDHANIHTGERPFKCKLCDKCFAYSHYLVAHVKAQHEDKLNPNAIKQILQCNICGKEFAHKKSLRLHRGSHDGSNICLCDICGKELSSKDHLKVHRRIHTNDKPNICEYCGKGFCKQGNLKLHERVHTGERPYTCDPCGKSFSQRSTLVIHMRCHTGERPYKCIICNKGFVCKALLTIHQRSSCV